MRTQRTQTFSLKRDKIKKNVHFMYMISLTGPPVMVDVEFKIISIGEIKEAQMVRGTLDLI